MSPELHVKFLSDELLARKERNPRYSMRAFATFLGLDCAALSRILSGKQLLSLQVAATVLNKLELSVEDQLRFIESVVYQRTQNELRELAVNAHLGHFELELHIHPFQSDLVPAPAH